METSNSLLSSFDQNGVFDVEQYVKVRSKRRAITAEEQLHLCMELAAEEETITAKNKRSRTRDVRGQMPKKLSEDGSMVPIDPHYDFVLLQRPFPRTFSHKAMDLC